VTTLRPITAWAEWRRFLDGGMLSSEALLFLTQHARVAPLVPFAVHELDGVRVERSWAGTNLRLAVEARFVRWCDDNLTQEAADALRVVLAERHLEKYE
jgi:hypothetical protein